MSNKQENKQPSAGAGNDHASSFRAADSSGIPVPSRFQIIEYLDSSEYPLRLNQLCDHFGLTNENDQSIALDSRLQRLCKSGVLLLDRKGRYGLSSKMDMVVGRISGHANGFGFVIPDSGGEDLYLHHRQMRKVLHGDRVLARVKKVDHRGKKEGSIIEVLVEQGREIIGKFHKQAGSCFVEPDDVRFSREISIPRKNVGDASDGDIVVVEIIAHPVENGHAVGKIVEVVGRELAPGMETEIALRKHEIPHVWPNTVNEYLKNNADRLCASKPGKDRVDLRDLALVTIDGADARDFDDAFCCKRISSGWRLVVAIADVSHYVETDNALDVEAYGRGTSVYFPNRVVPMLPEVLSNGICSLMPREDRNCLVCDMEVSESGQVEKRRFYQAVMHSHARLTYELVDGIAVRKDPELRKTWNNIANNLDDLYALSLCMRTRRCEVGSIDFDLPEAAIEFDDSGKISNIATRERNDAHRLIEECMLAANVCAAEFLQEKIGDQGIYRNHEGPDEEGLADMRRFISGFSLKLEGGNQPSALDYSRLLESIKDRPEVKGVIQTVLLRSLSQAVYSSDEIGHFALSFPIYTHFTSPIRRYSDLVVHRKIKRLIGIRGYKTSSPHGTSIGQVGEQCSYTERRAEDASRDVMGWLKAEFMQSKIGEEFEGTISGVKEFGVFVQLKKYLVDGLVHVTNLGHDYYHFDPVLLQLEGRKSGHRFKLGDRIIVRLTSVNLEEAKIDFELIRDNSDGKTDKLKARTEPKDKGKSKSGKKSPKTQSNKSSNQSSTKASSRGRSKSAKQSGARRKKS